MISQRVLLMGDLWHMGFGDYFFIKFLLCLLALNGIFPRKNENKKTGKICLVD